MKNLYKVKEYSEGLPNPKSFPVQGAIIYAIKDKPYTFADGLILDLCVRERDKLMLEGRVVTTLPFSNLDGIISDAERSVILLSEPEFIYDITYTVYIIFTPDNEPVAIQVKYYGYFRNRYPKCQFYSKGGERGIIAIKEGNKLLGACMPVFLEKETLIKIKEVRE